MSSVEMGARKLRRSSWTKNSQKLHSSYVDLSDLEDIESSSEHHHIIDRIYFQTSSTVMDSQFANFSMEDEFSKFDFPIHSGHMSLEAIEIFCNILDRQLEMNPNSLVAMSTLPCWASRLNAIIFLGAYMLIKIDIDMNTLTWIFDSLIKTISIERDADCFNEDFNLNIEDWWGGLFKAKQLGWLEFEPSEKDVHTDLTYPVNHHVQEIVPEKFLAVQATGLANGCGSACSQDIEMLLNLKVKVLIGLGGSEFDKGMFERVGIAVADLSFPERKTPSPTVIAKFMAIAEAVPGAIAVHCKAGLGQAEMLIGLYLMKNYGFTAREAIGWICIVRPGAMSSAQQHFICSSEALFSRSGNKSKAGMFRCRTQASNLVDFQAISAYISSSFEGVDSHAREFWRRRQERKTAPDNLPARLVSR